MDRLRWVIFFVGLFAVSNAVAFASGNASTPVHLREKAASKLLLAKVKPEYPPIADVNYIQGNVYIQVIVSAKGAVKEAHVVRGEPLLAASSLQAVHKWRFRPFRDGGRAKAFVTLFRFNFVLHTHNAQPMPAHPAQDLARAVKPPKLTTKPSQSSKIVRLRVLVGRDGKALDSSVIGGKGDAEEARQVVRGWKFIPARWGTMSVPWYLEVAVPVGGSRGTSATNPTGGV